MASATFAANPNSENEPWIERPPLQGIQFRIWHLMFFCLCAFGVLIVLICCCIRIRVPRTKQEIEADYKRKKIATKFRKRLKIISNQDMEAVDLRKALEIIIDADYQQDLQQQKAVVLQVNTDEQEKLISDQKSSFGKAVANVIKVGRLSMNKVN
ncbi:transmembrane inner ear expressed protein isoform X1 [Dendroctonus ponderosae]